MSNDSFLLNILFFVFHFFWQLFIHLLYSTILLYLPSKFCRFPWLSTEPSAVLPSYHLPRYHMYFHSSIYHLHAIVCLLDVLPSKFQEHLHWDVQVCSSSTLHHLHIRHFPRSSCSCHRIRIDIFLTLIFTSNYLSNPIYYTGSLSSVHCPHPHWHYLLEATIISGQGYLL